MSPLVLKDFSGRTTVDRDWSSIESAYGELTEYYLFPTRLDTMSSITGAPVGWRSRIRSTTRARDGKSFLNRADHRATIDPGRYSHTKPYSRQFAQKYSHRKVHNFVVGPARHWPGAWPSRSQLSTSRQPAFPSPHVWRILRL